RAAEAADRRADDSEVIAPPVQALAEDAAREAQRLRADRQPHTPRCRELLCDLDPGVRSADYERVAGWQLIRVAVLGAVELDDRILKLCPQLRNIRALIGAGRDDDALGLVLRAVRCVDPVATIGGAQP